MLGRHVERCGGDVVFDHRGNGRCVACPVCATGFGWAARPAAVGAPDGRGGPGRWRTRDPDPVGATTAQALALRAGIVLACAEPGASNKQIAASLGCSPATVGKWRTR